MESGIGMKFQITYVQMVLLFDRQWTLDLIVNNRILITQPSNEEYGKFSQLFFFIIKYGRVSWHHSNLQNITVPFFIYIFLTKNHINQIMKLNLNLFEVWNHKITKIGLLLLFLTRNIHFFLYSFAHRSSLFVPI